MEKENVYVFSVRKQANKYSISKEIEELFGVNVEKINTSIRPGKSIRVGRSLLKKSQTKRAFVKLKKDQKIEFFKGI